MTPAEQAFNNQIKNDPIVQQILNSITMMTNSTEQLTTNQKTIMNMVEEDRKQNKLEFEHGSDKLKSLEGDMLELSNKVGLMSVEIRKGFQEQKKDFAQHVSDSKDDEIQKLNKRLDARNQIKNGVIITLIGGILLTLCIYGLSRLGIEIK